MTTFYVSTWLEYLVIRAISHIQSTQLDCNLITSSLAYCKSHFDYIGLWVLQDFLCDRDVQGQFNVGNVDSQPHRPMCWERLTILIEQLKR